MDQFKTGLFPDIQLESIVISGAEANVIEKDMIDKMVRCADRWRNKTCFRPCASLAVTLMFLKKMKEAFGLKYHEMPPDMLKLIDIASETISEAAKAPTTNFNKN